MVEHEAEKHLYSRSYAYMTSIYKCGGAGANGSDGGDKDGNGNKGAGGSNCEQVLVSG